MNNKHTDITIVLDRSGSMASVTDDTIGGFNTFLEEQQKQEGTASITLYQFDHEFITTIDAALIDTAKKLDRTTYVPRGSTALLDAIGRAINETGKRLKSTPEQERAGKVVFVIITDGEENSSHEFDNKKIREMINHQTDKYKWQFVYLGADQDSFAVAGNFGIAAGSTMNFAKSGGRTRILYQSLSSNISAYRNYGEKTVSFKDADRAEQDEEIVKNKTQ